MTAKGWTKQEEDALLALCSPRPLPRVEYSGGNELYGYADVIKDYAGLEPAKPLPVLIPHGVSLSEDFVDVGDKRAGYPAVFSYPAYRDAAYRRRMRMMVIPSASPFLYALETVNSPTVERKGVLFFPAHSLPGIPAEQDWQELARRLSVMALEGETVRVCLYWADVLAGRHKAFTDKGLEVVSAGHSHDSKFIERLIALLRAHRFAASNAWGSHLFYAVVAGCEFFFLGDLPTRGGDRRMLSLQAATASPGVHDEMLRVRELAAYPGHEHSQLLESCAEKYLRADALMNRGTMREYVRLCEELDRKGSLFTAGVPALQGPFPRAWYRWLKECAVRILGRRREVK